MPSSEENINSLGTAVQHNFRRTVLGPSSEEFISVAWALRYSITPGARCCHLVRRISVGWALRYSITSGARYWCHLGRRISVASSLGAAVQHNLAPSTYIHREGAKRSARGCNGTRRGCNRTHCNRLATGLRVKPKMAENALR